MGAQLVGQANAKGDKTMLTLCNVIFSFNV